MNGCIRDELLIDLLRAVRGAITEERSSFKSHENINRSRKDRRLLGDGQGEEV